MKFWLGCVCSAVLGGLFACYLQDAARAPSQAEAQDRPLRGPALRPPFGDERERQPVAAQPPQTAYDADPFGADGMTPEEAVNVSVYEQVNKSVVNITTKSVKAEGLFSIESSAEGAGSGSVLDVQGHILTNNHVIEDAREVSVTLHNGKSYDATFVGADAINDIAIIKIDAPPEILFPVNLGDSSGLKVGMRVFAIGNPFGLERTLTTGIISSLNRSLTIHGNRTIKSIIQIDAAINPGNSGGPLMDAHGQLIGMNTAIASRTGQSAGVGFAIPVNLIGRIVPQLIKKGHIVRPEVGISRVYQTEEGLRVALLAPGGPAERAGLRGPQIVRKRRGPFVLERIDRSAADLIIAVDGKDSKTADEFLSLVERHEPGEEVVLTVIREKRELRIPVRLGSSEEASRKAEKR